MNQFQKLTEETRHSKLQTSETTEKLKAANKEAARKLLVSMMSSGMVSSMVEQKKEVKDI